MIPLKTLGRWLRPGLLLSLLVMLTGCDAVAILSPKGQIGQDEKTLLITATVLMLLVVIPVIIMTLTFAWKYRASNTKARYEPKWSHSTAIEVVVWSIPCMIVLVLAVLTWRSSHALDPYKPLDSDVKPVTIEAISLDWKWLFIYPEEKVAVVNEIKFPVNTPLNFKITSDSVMNAFFIPHLGSMIYSMAAMETKLHLIANETGEFPGMSSHYSGAGFAKMHFTAYSVTDAEYRQWLDQVRAGEQTLDKASFKALGEARNAEWYPVTYFGKTEEGLFDWVIAKHMGDNKHYGMKHKAPADGAAAEGHDAHAGHEGHEGHTDAAAAPAEHAGHTADEHAAAGHAGHAGSGE
ncbi:ubiquinol oxidase subunit II [Stenotrophomonas maltophilia]|uniref:ubiquinol oxidase subunit II n=1 Tax=Stenotrophomonas maltophilia TaxID=40324 RepID=UPI0015DCB736|nr:ubiquinol oxidase subunit II [Stenotrophomonas maltophilia]QDL27316.1 ubiquinol oxidase subunit II [Stenotrophomonas maltophilia]